LGLDRFKNCEVWSFSKNRGVEHGIERKQN
jgi:hypothetical protein